MNENGLRQRCNFKLFKLFKEVNVIKTTKTGRLRFVGYICRMEHSSLALRIFNYNPIGTRTRGRPKLRCADFKVLRSVTKRRSEWKRILGKVLTHLGLLC
ncbi:hypothetical protein TNCV_9121 [Trichonephila clavipes]|nr:hypothetical protein TNCV_9121 [Trichonephila clavipes]